MLIHIEHCNSGWILAKSKQHHQKFVLAWDILGIGSLHIPTISWELQWFSQKDHMEILGKCLDKKTHWTSLPSIIWIQRFPPLAWWRMKWYVWKTRSVLQSSIILNYLGVVFCSPWVLYLQSQSPCKIDHPPISCCHHLAPSIRDRSGLKIDCTDPSHRCHGQSCFLQHLYFFLHQTKTKNIKVRCSIYPSSMLPSCKKKSNYTSSIKNLNFFPENCVRCLWTCLWHSFHFCHLYPLWCLVNQNPVGVLWKHIWHLWSRTK